jgi:hypothetical protein
MTTEAAHGFFFCHPIFTAEVLDRFKAIDVDVTARALRVGKM